MRKTPEEVLREGRVLQAILKAKLFWRSDSSGWDTVEVRTHGDRAFVVLDKPGHGREVVEAFRGRHAVKDAMRMAAVVRRARSRGNRERLVSSPYPQLRTRGERYPIGLSPEEVWDVPGGVIARGRRRSARDAAKSTANAYWRRRGLSDANAGRSPLFRNTRSRGIYAVAEGYQEDALSEREAGKAYLAGYDGEKT